MRDGEREISINQIGVISASIKGIISHQTKSPQRFDLEINYDGESPSINRYQFRTETLIPTILFDAVDLAMKIISDTFSGLEIAQQTPDSDSDLQALQQHIQTPPQKVDQHMYEIDLEVSTFV